MYQLKPQDKFNKDFTTILAELLSENASEYNKFKLLNEDDKSSITKSFANFIFKKGNEILNDNSFKSFKASQGDITKMSEFDNLTQCLISLTKLQQKNTTHSSSISFRSSPRPSQKFYREKSTTRNSPTRLTELNNVYKYLTDRKNIELFKKGFSENNDLIKLTYLAMATNLYQAVSLVIAEFILVIRPSLNKNNKPELILSDFPRDSKNINHPSFGLIEEYSASICTGKIDQMLRMALDKGQILNEEPAIIATIVIASVIFLIIFLRNFVAQYFKMRTFLADWLEIQANFLKINANSLVANNPEAASKQLKYVESLQKLSKKVSLKATESKDDYIKVMDKDLKAKEITKEEISASLI